MSAVYYYSPFAFDYVYIIMRFVSCPVSFTSGHLVLMLLAVFIFGLTSRNGVFPNLFPSLTASGSDMLLNDR